MQTKIKSHALPKNKTIIFIRHGKPMLHSLYSLMRPIKGIQFNQYCHEYEQSTIDPAYPPPKTVINIIGNACHYVSSDLRRAKDSSAMLPFINTVFYKSLREAEMPQTRLTNLSLPLIAWMALSRIKWQAGMNGDDSESRQTFITRIESACDLLHQTASEKQSIAVLSHGIAIHYLKQALIDKGWRSGQTSLRHWGITRLEG